MYFLGRTTGGYAKGKAEGVDDATNAIDGPQFTAKGVGHTGSYGGDECGWNGGTATPLYFGDADRHLTAPEQVQRFGKAHIDAVFGGKVNQRAASERFAVDQHAVAIEDYQVERAQWARGLGAAGHRLGFGNQTEEHLLYWQFVPWLMKHGFDLSRLVADLFTNRIGSFFGIRFPRQPAPNRQYN